MLSFISANEEPWRRIIGVFDDRVDRIGDNVDGHPLLGTLDDLIDYERRSRIDDIVIAIPWNADQRLMEIINKLRELPVGIFLGTDLVGYRFPKLFHSTIGNIPVIEVHTKPLTGWRAIVKFLEDYTIASALIFMIFPLLLLICAAIRLESRGPVIFRQQRYGFNNKTITVFKFRSMYHGRPPEEGVPQAQRDDPRVTRVGRFLRRTSLDELPQLFNVLNGSMSLVGPRPCLPYEYDEYNEWQRKRLAFKPGITGVWQVYGRSRVQFDEMVFMDICGRLNRSIIGDLKLIALTLPVALLGKGAE